MQFYTYIYCDPRKPNPQLVKGTNIVLKNEPIYVGKGTNDRFKDHLKWPHRVKKLNIIFFSKLEKIRKDGLIPNIIVIPHLSESDAFDNEKYLIKTLGRISVKTGCLTNLTEGGCGGFRGQDIVDKIQNTKRLNKLKPGYINPLKGRKRPIEVVEKKNRTVALKLSLLSEEDKAILTQKRKDREAKKIRKLVGNKEVCQIDIDTLEIIAEYQSVCDASQAVGLKRRADNISYACRRAVESKTFTESKGFYWLYTEDIYLMEEMKIFIPGENVKKKIVQIDPISKRILFIYNSIAEAIETTQANDIQGAIIRKGISKNSRWKYFEEGDVIGEVALIGDKDTKDYRKVTNIVEQYSLSGELLNTFKSAGQAARILKLGYTGITHCCAGQTKTGFGYKWVRKEI